MKQFPRCVPLTNSVLLALSLGLGGCVDQLARQDTVGLRRQLEDLRRTQATQTAQLGTLDAEVRALNGRLEEMSFGQRQKIDGVVTDLQRGLTDLEKRVPPPPVVPNALLEFDEKGNSDIPTEFAQNFSDALARIRRGKFDSALPLLRDVVDGTTGTSAAGYALFWSGVAFEGIGDQTKALAAYSEISQSYGKHVRAPASLLRLASIFTSLNDNKTAKITLQKLAKEFPKADEARIAKERLKLL